jgi:hypothetical protein
MARHAESTVLTSEALKRRLRASNAGAASWACDCGTDNGAHALDCRRERRRLDARKGGLKTLERYGSSHFRRLRWRQLLADPAEAGRT